MIDLTHGEVIPGSGVANGSEKGRKDAAEFDVQARVPANRVIQSKRPDQSVNGLYISLPVTAEQLSAKTLYDKQGNELTGGLTDLNDRPFFTIFVAPAFPHAQITAGDSDNEGKVTEYVLSLKSAIKYTVNYSTNKTNADGRAVRGSFQLPGFVLGDIFNGPQQSRVKKPSSYEANNAYINNIPFTDLESFASFNERVNNGALLHFGSEDMRLQYGLFTGHGDPGSNRRPHTADDFVAVRVPAIHGTIICLKDFVKIRDGSKTGVSMSDDVLHELDAYKKACYDAYDRGALKPPVPDSLASAKVNVNLGYSNAKALVISDEPGKQGFVRWMTKGEIRDAHGAAFRKHLLDRLPDHRSGEAEAGRDGVGAGVSDGDEFSS